MDSSSNLKAFADDNIKFHENGRKLSKIVENNVGNTVRAIYPFPTVFSKDFYTYKPRLVWKRIIAPFTVIVAFETSVNQDQTAKNVLEHGMRKRSSNLSLS